jgi:two-component system response regulator MtrA
MDLAPPAETAHNARVPKRVLLVEDDPELGAQIARRLREAGYHPTWWREGRAVGPDTLPEVDLVVLDLMLPGVPGMTLLEQIRACSGVPVLVLSARNDTEDKVRALRLGADDYVTKPFWPDELLERVRARLRRPAMAGGGGGVVEAGALRLDLERREARVDGARVDLTRVELDLLAMLAERPGAALTRRAIAARVLDAARDGGERTLDVHVSRLRKKLGPAVVVETVWGIGYRLAADRGASPGAREG